MTTRLTDGTTTITLDSESAVAAVSFFPQAGQPGERVVDDVRVIVEDTAANVQSLVRQINSLLSTARRWYDGPQQERVYLEYQSAADAAHWRSAIKDGRVVFADEPLRHKLNTTAVGAEFVIVIERESEWEGAETALKSSGSSSWGIANGSAASIDSIDGELPAPVLFNVTNGGSTESWSEIWIDNFIDTGWGVNDNIAVAADSSSWAAGVNHDQQFFVTPLDSDQLAGCAGNYCHLLARFNSLSTQVYLRAGIWTYIGGTAITPLVVGQEIYTGEAAGTANTVIDLGAFPLPPSGDGSDTGNLAVVITGRTIASGSGYLNRVYLMPNREYRRVRQIGYNTPAGAAVVVDEPNQSFYLKNGSARYSIVAPYAKPLRVHPGTGNRIGVVVRAGSVWSSSTLTLSGSYRPRRLSI